MHFKDIEINNFRGFDHLKIEDFGQINLFVGKNNSGKTSVLESLYLLSGCDRPELLEVITRKRKSDNSRNTLQNNDYLEVFHQFNDESELKIVCSQIKYDDTIENDRFLIIEPGELTYKDEINSAPLVNPILKSFEYTFGNSTSSSIRKGYPSFEIPAEWLKTFLKNFTGNEDSEEAKDIVNKLFDFKNTLQGHFIDAKISEQEILEYLNDLIINRKSRRLIPLLKQIDFRIQDIQSIGNTIFFDMEGINQMIPSHIVGDGLRKIVTIISAVYHKQSIILIDEIENGLHYTAHKTLWKGIIEACRISNAQIFATTHSLESLKCLNEVLQENEYNDFQEKVRCYDLVKTKLKGFQAYKYNYEGFSHALEMETEIR